MTRTWAWTTRGSCTVTSASPIPARFGPGDSLVCVTTVEESRVLGGMGFLTTRTDLGTDAGEPVVSVWSRLVVRGES